MSSERILVTGACGFIGSHLVEMLVREGHEVVAFDRYNSESEEGWLGSSPCRKHIDLVLGDIRDLDSVQQAAEECTGIMHLAALIGIPYSYLSPLAYLRTNVEGTYNVLEAARYRKIDNVLLTSTSEVYGSAQYVPIDEHHPLVAQSPYSASKIAADQLGLSYFRSFGLPLRIARPFNTFGPRQSGRAVIPTIIRQLLLPEENLQLGNTSPRRDFTYVEDTCRGLITLYLSSNCVGEVTNIGSGHEISISELARIIGDLMGKGSVVETDARRLRPDDSEVSRLLCDSTKLKSQLKWEPLYTLKEGLKETIEWHKSRIADGKKFSSTYNV